MDRMSIDDFDSGLGKSVKAFMGWGQISWGRLRIMWKAEDSIELYGIENWGNGYFSVNDKGNIIIFPNKDPAQSVDIMDLIEEIEKSKDLEFPVLLAISSDAGRSDQ